MKIKITCSKCSNLGWVKFNPTQKKYNCSKCWEQLVSPLYSSIHGRTRNKGHDLELITCKISSNLRKKLEEASLKLRTNKSNILRCAIQIFLQELEEEEA